MSLSAMVSKRWMWLCGALSGTMLLGAACGAPEGEAEAPATVEHAQPLGTCTPSTSGTTICGVVTNAAGVPLAGATVNVGPAWGVSAADGSFSVTASVPMGTQVTIDIPGYMPYVGAVTRNVLGARFVLHSLHRQTFSASGVVTVTDPRNGASIQVNLSALQSATGEQVQGPLTVGVRHIDTGLLAMPGTDGAVNLGGQQVFLESRGAIYTEVRDRGGQILKLAPGATARVFIPLTRDQLNTAPTSIAFWSMPVGSNLWRQQPSNGTRAPNPVQCNNRETASCNADDCARISGSGFSANTNEIGFINADIEKTNPACLRIDVNVASLPPGTTLPICLELEIPLPTGGSQTRNICVGGGTDVLFNLPSNANIVVRQAQGNGCPAPPPGGSVTVNTGAPWGGTGVPASPGQCNGVLTLPPLP
ncbi:hypothetical protein SAMN05443572_103197 [Myxococcus fulvus]|uniref:Lipoprotein n=1 Tax=Myxococcus fulvus TaxID=33 RepID=A0A511TAX3_MYXFU|nr:carboxypeptidase-like regulatory domain-containing protein [Myxococcus fulvus]GEN10632.1 hypothetical protein MFU01_56690 [Myxococcus fulvus]SET78157.1 hypothetical protein SAMN05443572_103197 [Myxococcus fulvus]